MFKRFVEEYLPLNGRVDYLIARWETNASSHIAEAETPQPAKIAGKQFYLSLLMEPASTEAIRFIDELTAMVGSPKRGSRQPIIKAVGALIADLFAATEYGANGQAFRPMGNDTFRGQRIGIKPFRKAVQRLVTLDLICVERGFRAPPVKGHRGQATTFTPLGKLLELSVRYGIEPANYRDHFQKAFEPVLLRTAAKKSKGEWGDRIPGKRMRVDVKHPIVVATTKKLEAINAVLQSAVYKWPVGKIDRPRLRRIFNNGDELGSSYTYGGRLYAEGNSYQSIERRHRGAITINGEATAEIDVSGCYYTIAATKLGEAIDRSRDCYDVPGTPRPIVKLYVNSSLGSGKPIYKWPSALKEEYAKPDNGDDSNDIKWALLELGAKYTGNLQIDYPIAEMKRIVLPRFAFLNDLARNGITWGALQYTESSVMLDAVHELCAEHGIVALPIHDSVICPVSKIELVKEVLSRTFYEHVGVTPVLKVKHGASA